jgi:LPS-assembly protein
MRAMVIRCDSGGPRRLQVRALLLCGVLGLIAPVLAVAAPGAAPDTLESTPVEPAVRDTADASGGRLAGRYWVDRDALSEADRAGRPAYCSGGYVLPEFPYPLDSNPDDFPLEGDAENVTYFLDGRVTLDGAVTLTQGNRRITGRQGSLDQNTGKGLMTGTVQVLEPGLVLEGRAARVDLESRAASLEGVEFLIPEIEIRGQAETITQDADGNLVITDARFTRCEPGNRNWHLAVGSLEINEADVFATARNATVRVGNTPVFYAPYLRFPVRPDRQSGVLFPDVGVSEQDGVDIRVPYYLNLAPDYDATLAPRYISDRGAGLEGEFRHLTGWGRTLLTGTYLYEDDIFDGTLTRDDFDRLRQSGVVTGEFKPADRWLYGIDHAGQIGNFRTVVDYRAVSDRDYFRDLGGDVGVASRFELERRGEIGYDRGGLRLRLWAQRFDRLDDGTVDPYERLPQFDVRYDGRLLGPLEWSLAAQLASFDRTNSGLTGVERAVGERLHVAPRITLPFYRPWGYLSFTGGVRHTAYDLRQIDDPEIESSPDRSIGHGSVEGGLYFDRTVQAFGRTVNHSLEPQAFYLYQGYDNQDALPTFDASELTFSYNQLFRDNRFAGLDRIGDANQLSLGLTTRFVDSRDGREYLRASLGQILYFEDRRVTLAGLKDKADEQRTSAVAGEVAGSLTERWRVTSTVIWNPSLGEIDEGAVALQHLRDDRHILNFGYRYRNSDNISQPDLSAYWPISRHFGVIGRWNYDFEQERVIEAFGGLEYNDCCWRIRLVARRFLSIPTGPNIVTGQEVEVVRPDDGLFLQIVFKGMGGVGSSLESMLARGIRGYRTEDYNGL